MKRLEEAIAEHMKNPEFKKEWEVPESEFCRKREEIIEDLGEEKNNAVGYAV